MPPWAGVMAQAVAELSESVQRNQAETGRDTGKLEGELAHLSKRFDAMGVWLREKLQPPAAAGEHCDPMHGQKPTPQAQCELFKALAAWHATAPSMVKDQVATVKMESGSSYSYNFADLGQATELAHTAGKFGLSTFQAQLQNGQLPIVRAYLLHEGGGFIYADAPVFPKSSKGDRKGQDWASGFTFARRYALCSVLGIAAKGEDDDNGPSGSDYGPRGYQGGQTRNPAAGRPPTTTTRPPAGSQPTRTAPTRAAATVTRATPAPATQASPAGNAGASVPRAGHSAPPAAPGWGTAAGPAAASVGPDAG